MEEISKATGVIIYRTRYIIVYIRAHRKYTCRVCNAQRPASHMWDYNVFVLNEVRQCSVL